MTAPARQLGFDEEIGPTKTVKLPLPPRALTSNQNVHWRASSEPKKAYRALGKEAGTTLFASPPHKLRMVLEFCIGSLRSVKCQHKRRARKDGKPLRPCLRCPYGPRDQSNALAAFKSAQDGLCEGIGIDDSHKHLEIGAIRIRKDIGPYVLVHLEVVS